ncbi:MAG: IS5 family transposase [Blastocatellia bacterium]|nr:IS5 family transposase [Blastocatellia bacterium]
MNGILYVARTGCAWRMLLKTFPPWQTVYGYFWRWTHSGLCAQINAVSVQRGSRAAECGHHRQSERQNLRGWRTPRDRCASTHAGTQAPPDRRPPGLVLMVVVHSASLQDGAGGKRLLQKLFDQIKCVSYNCHCRLKTIWADGAYQEIADWVKLFLGWTLDLVRRPAGGEGWRVLPKRWIIERTFRWLGRYRRLSRDFEHTVASSEAFVYIASIRRMLKLAV